MDAADAKAIFELTRDARQWRSHSQYWLAAAAESLCARIRSGEVSGDDAMLKYRSFGHELCVRPRRDCGGVDEVPAKSGAFCAL